MENRLATDLVPMFCPGCGRYQPEMIAHLKRSKFPLFFQPPWLRAFDVLAVIFAVVGVIGIVLWLTRSIDGVAGGMGMMASFPFAVLFTLRVVVFVINALRRKLFDPYRGTTAEERMAQAQRLTVANRPMAQPILTPILDDDQRMAQPTNSPVIDE
jgi:hypothetical protein